MAQIIILSSTYTTGNSNILVINEPITLVDENHLLVNSISYTFDYLIFTNPLQIINFNETSITNHIQS